jgi:hypothetical protein
LTSCIENTTVHKLYNCCIHYYTRTTCSLLLSNRLDFLHRRTQLYTSCTTIYCCVHYDPSTTCLMLLSNRLDFLHRRTQLYTNCTNKLCCLHCDPSTTCPLLLSTRLDFLHRKHNCTQAVQLLYTLLYPHHLLAIALKPAWLPAQENTIVQYTSCTTIYCCVHYYTRTTCPLLLSNRLGFLHRKLNCTQAVLYNYTLLCTLWPQHHLPAVVLKPAWLPA